MNKNEMYRMIPKTDILLKEKEIQELADKYGRQAVVGILQEILQELREKAAELADGGREEEGAEVIGQTIQQLPGRVHERLEQLFRPEMISVVNGTGIILHTGLGRAPLGEQAGLRGGKIAGTYTNLELDLNTGERGERCAHFERLLCRITGAEAALAVNNNAAAVLLILTALARGGEAAVSRGELVEIGGKFRIPDVMEQSGTRLREVGTTNRTRLSDYENAIHEETKVLLKVHTSNYRIVGFTESVSLEELCALGKQKGICVVQDLGSGVLVDLSRYGLRGEPTVQASVSAGADVVCFSGDKLLGGPQAGIIVGKKCFLDRMRKHPLARALRIDKFTAAALEQVLLEYLNPDQAIRRIPVLRMLTRPADEVRQEAELLAEEIRQKRRKKYGENYRGITAQITVEPCTSRAGGGALPEEEVSSFALCVRPGQSTGKSAGQSTGKSPGQITGKSAGQITGKSAGQISAAELQRRLRTLPVPVLGRIVRDRFLVDMRTVSDTDREYLAELFSGEELFSPGTFRAPDGMEQKAEPEKGSGL